MPTILAIDYGLARIGLAVSFVGLAEPLKVIKNDLAGHDLAIGPQALKEIQTIIESEKVEKVVVGVSEYKMAEKTLDFVNYLKSLINLEIILVDETLSSYEVEQKLKDLPKKVRRQAIDHYAAALILENYLDLC
jgi:putative transcription antitermination factor YqgF